MWEKRRKVKLMSGRKEENKTTTPDGVNKDMVLCQENGQVK